jgi:hypothetical protein
MSAQPVIPLPSERHVHPNVSILLTIPRKAADAYGPLIAADQCSKISEELRKAAEHPSIAGVIMGPLGVGAPELEIVADWFSGCADALREVVQ